MLKRLLPFMALVLLVAGCLTRNSVSTLTPRTVPRSADGLYLIEARWQSNQRSVRDDSFEPSVVVGMEFYPMQRTPKTSNRWEALVPIPSNQRFINYRFKFDYEYNGIPQRMGDSQRSREYQLEIVEK